MILFLWMILLATTLTIGGAAVDPVAYPLGRFTVWSKGGCPNGTIFRRGVKLPGLPDPWLGKQLTLSVGGTVVFNGEVTAAGEPAMTPLGWTIPYNVLGLRYLLDKFPVTDDNTGLDTVAFNLDPQDTLNYIASRAGRNVGQMLTTVLTMQTNSYNINAYGLGAYTSMGPPAVLPAATAADLAAMTFQPPGAAYFGGEKMGGAIEGFLEQWAPNYCLWIDPPTGTLRFLDVRSFTTSSPHTFTMNLDPIETTALTRDVSGCFQRVLVRGSPLSEAWLMTLLNKQLVEDFAWGPYTSDQAKAAYVAGNNGQQGAYQDSGTCTCPGTTTITVTSSNAATNWVANFWDQSATGAGGSVNLVDTSILTGLQVQAQRRVIANTALSAGGTSTLTLDLPLPSLTFSQYQIYGANTGPSVVYRKYKCANATAGAALQTQFSYPQAFVSANGLLAAMTSTPSGSVVYGTPPYFEFPLSFTQNPSDGTFMMVKSTYIIAGNAPPHDVRVLAAVATGVNHAAAPADVGGVAQFAGTSHTMEGLTDTLIISAPAWKDPANLANMQAYASDVLDTVKDGNLEGSIRYKGLYTAALTPGISCNLAGNGFTTGWEAATIAAIPCVQTDLEWGYTGAMDHHTTMHLSNRRQHYGQGAFLRPSRIGLTWGSDDSLNLTRQAARTGLAGMAAGGPAAAGLGAIAGAAAWDPAAEAAAAAASLPTSMADLGLPTGEGLGLGGPGNRFARAMSPAERIAAAALNRQQEEHEQKTRQEAIAARPRGGFISPESESETMARTARQDAGRPGGQAEADAAEHERSEQERLDRGELARQAQERQEAAEKQRTEIAARNEEAARDRDRRSGG